MIAIRPYAIDDAPRLFEAATESIPVVFPWLEWCHPGYLLAEAQEWIGEQVDAFARRDAFEFLIENDSGLFLGGCGLNKIDRSNRSANLGYWVRTSAARAGIATQAVRQLAAWAFSNTDLLRLEIVVATGNLPSMRVAEKAGAMREGVARARLVLQGHSHDAVVFSLLR